MYFFFLSLLLLYEAVDGPAGHLIDVADGDGGERQMRVGQIGRLDRHLDGRILPLDPHAQDEGGGRREAGDEQGDPEKSAKRYRRLAVNLIPFANVPRRSVTFRDGTPLFRRRT